MKTALVKKMVGGLGVVFFIVLGVGIYHFTVDRDAVSKWSFSRPVADGSTLPGTFSESQPGRKRQTSETAKDASNQAVSQVKESFEDRLVRELKTIYGDTINEKSTQVMLLKVKRFVLNLYPKEGATKFYNIIKRAFPRLADEIMATLKQMEAYKRWLQDNDSALSQMDDLVKQGELWKKRKAIFGDDAAEIWSEDVLAFEQRKQEMRDTVSFLENSTDTSLDEKLDLYKNTLSETYENSPEAYILKSTDMLTKVFLGIDSVQEKLKAMPPEQRQAEINRIRGEMGFSEEQVAEMENVDHRREKRWENGLSYMTARQSVVDQYEGVELNDQLKALRKQYFKHEAKTIEIEEQDGFFRYARKRVYGRN